MQQLTQPALLGTAVVGLVVLGLVIGSLMRNTALGWWLLAGFVLASADLLPRATDVVTLGGIAIYPTDLAAMVWLIGFMVRERSEPAVRERRVIRWLWLVMILLGAYSLGRGLNDFPAPATFAEGRGMFTLAAATIWIASERSKPNFDKLLARFLLLTAWGLVALAVFHILTRGLGSADAIIQEGDAAITGRALNSSQSLVLLLAGVYAATRNRWISVMAFLLVAVLAQNRSVWVAGIAVLIVLLLAPQTNRWTRNVLAHLVVFASVAALCVWIAGYTGGFVSDLATSASSRGTLNGRLSDWSYLTAQQASRGQYYVWFGQPFGTGFVRPLGQNLIAYIPHNWYVALYLRIGLLGAVAWSAALLVALGRHWRERATLQLAAAVAIAVYSIFYYLSWDVAPLVALAFMSPLASLSGVTARRPAGTCDVAASVHELEAPDHRARRGEDRGGVVYQ